MPQLPGADHFSDGSTHIHENIILHLNDGRSLPMKTLLLLPSGFVESRGVNDVWEYIPTHRIAFIEQQR